MVLDVGRWLRDHTPRGRRCSKGSGARISRPAEPSNSSQVAPSSVYSSAPAETPLPAVAWPRLVRQPHRDGASQPTIRPCRTPELTQNSESRGLLSYEKARQ